VFSAAYNIGLTVEYNTRLIKDKTPGFDCEVGLFKDEYILWNCVFFFLSRVLNYFTPIFICYFLFRKTYGKARISSSIQKRDLVFAQFREEHNELMNTTHTTSDFDPDY